ncbi:hypothetical protein [Tahibacter caeni]|uniref:hypothetical protein n=1 Tax=Tahibacter caeni TaxID=1453545 RepID=UPI00214777EA|nr:hypothetical protein [Tahibacter caeni]
MRTAIAVAAVVAFSAFVAAPLPAQAQTGMGRNRTPQEQQDKQDKQDKQDNKKGEEAPPQQQEQQGDRKKKKK